MGKITWKVKIIIFNFGKFPKHILKLLWKLKLVSYTHICTHPSQVKKEKNIFANAYGCPLPSAIKLELYASNLVDMLRKCILGLFLKCIVYWECWSSSWIYSWYRENWKFSIYDNRHYNEFFKPSTHW